MLIENLKLQKNTKEDMQFWAIKIYQGGKKVDIYRNVLWGMSKALLREGLMDTDTFIKIAKFANAYQEEHFVELIDELNKLWAKNSEVSFGKLISIVIGCLESDYYTATENDWIDAILKVKNNKLTNEYNGITYYIYPSANGYVGAHDKLKIYTDYKDKYEDVIKEMENKILECGGKNMCKKELLLKNIHDALLNIRYISSVTEYEKTFMPHQIKAIEEAILPIINKFFEKNTVQSKKKIWDENI